MRLHPTRSTRRSSLFSQPLFLLVRTKGLSSAAKLKPSTARFVRSSGPLKAKLVAYAWEARKKGPHKNSTDAPREGRAPKAIRAGITLLSGIGGGSVFLPWEYALPNNYPFEERGGPILKAQSQFRRSVLQGQERPQPRTLPVPLDGLAASPRRSL